MRLHELLVRAARQHPARLAVHGPDGQVSYAELDRLADRFAAALLARGVRPGDRVLLWCAKAASAVALLQGCLRVGAVYVPVSPGNPPPRLGRIAASCSAVLVVTDAAGAERAAGAGWSPAPLATLDELLSEATDAAAVAVPVGSDTDLAYILYTSGSTGEPKGVCISHRNALAFVEWAATELALTCEDRLANHAPFNFDLSVFDLYAAFLAGASVHLISEEMGYAPAQLGAFVRQRQLTVWYSVPSALLLMMEHSDVLDDPPETLRVCVFAGEPFPGPRVRQLRRAWPDVRLFNWYGPTETNVCLSYEVGPDELLRDGPIPIGRPCSGDAVHLDVLDAGEEDGETELVVTGPTVMLGYWGGPPAGPSYRTGDLVRPRPDGLLEYVGRHDQMVKVRGHRVELGEIEAAIAVDPRVADVVALVVGQGLTARLHAVVRPVDGGEEPSLLDLKRRCAERLPTYMVIDTMHTTATLPRTANGKTDRRRLAAELAGQLGSRVF